MAATLTGKRSFTAIPLSDIVIVPAENYRWGSEEAMKADVEAQTLDEDGAAVNTYQRLKDSLAETGLRDPVGLIQRDDGYHVVYGFTRTLAAKELGWETVDAYVYPSTLSAAEVQTLQLQENSTSLRRTVNWIATVEAFKSLMAKVIARLVSSGEMDAAQAKKTAKGIVSRSLGVTYPVISMRAVALKRLHPDVVACVRKHNWSYAVAVEFYSGDVENPFSGDFIRDVLESVKRAQPDLNQITPASIRKAKTLVAQRVGRTKVFADAEKAEVAKLTQDSRLTGGAVRDACVGILYASIAKDTNIKTFSPEKLEMLKKTASWNQVLGLGIASGEIQPPASAARAMEARAPDTATDTTMDSLYGRTSVRWGYTTAIQALLMRHVEFVTGKNFYVWEGIMKHRHPSARMRASALVAAAAYKTMEWFDAQVGVPSLHEAALKIIQNFGEKVTLQREKT
jgi:hypothetical protein